MRDHNYHVYIITTSYNTVLYAGVTNNLERRVYEHRNRIIEGFTKKYNLTKLVYHEHYENIEEAIACEKEIKGWKRYKKNSLVATMNPDRDDLAGSWY